MNKNEFKSETNVGLDALSSLAVLQQRYQAGPRAKLNEEQLALCAAFDALYPHEKLRIANAAAKERRQFVTGADLAAEQVEVPQQ